MTDSSQDRFYFLDMGKKLKVLVLMGGPSPEHEISLNTGKEVAGHLDTQRYEVNTFVVPRSGRWKFPAARPDVAFVAMHGVYGEDGTIQKLLEDEGILYTGSGVLASALGMDKPRSCAIFREAGLNVPEFVVYTRSDRVWLRGQTAEYPCVVKPANHGSSVGVHIVKNEKELRAGIKDALRYSTRVILQKFIPG